MIICHHTIDQNPSIHWCYGHQYNTSKETLKPTNIQLVNSSLSIGCPALPFHFHPTILFFILFYYYFEHIEMISVIKSPQITLS